MVNFLLLCQCEYFVVSRCAVNGLFHCDLLSCCDPRYHIATKPLQERHCSTAEMAENALTAETLTAKKLERQARDVLPCL